MGRKLALLQDDPCSVNEAAKIVRTFDVWCGGRVGIFLTLALSTANLHAVQYSGMCTQRTCKEKVGWNDKSANVASVYYESFLGDVV